jgi:hypothetical protein
LSSQPIDLSRTQTQQYDAESEILAKAHKLGWSRDEIEMLLFTYGPALSLDADGNGNKNAQRGEKGAHA